MSNINSSGFVLSGYKSGFTENDTITELCYLVKKFQSKIKTKGKIIPKVKELVVHYMKIE